MRGEKEQGEGEREFEEGEDMGEQRQRDKSRRETGSDSYV